VCGAGMLYKCAEIADGLVAALIPWSRDSDLMGNPAFITASLGATLTEVLPRSFGAARCSGC